MARSECAAPAGLYALALAVLAALLVACGGGQPASTPGDASKAVVAADPTTLRRGNGPEPDALDPQRSRVDGSFKIQRDFGIDSPSIDLGKDKTFSVHKIFAKNNILIVENLSNLNKISSKQFEFIILPLKIKDTTGSPVRAIAIQRTK